MKVCKKCGAIYSDYDFTCLECSESLGKKLSVEEEQNLNQKLTDTISSQLEEYDNEIKGVLIPSIIDKVFGFINLFFCIGNFVLMIVSFFVNSDKALDSFLFLIPLFLFLTFSLQGISPQILWRIKLFSDSLHYDNLKNATPTFYYKITTRILMYISLPISILLLVGIIYICYYIK